MTELTFQDRLRVHAAVGTAVILSPDGARLVARLTDEARVVNDDALEVLGHATALMEEADAMLTRARRYLVTACVLFAVTAALGLWVAI